MEAAARIVTPRPPPLYAMRRNARCSQCTRSSAPTSSASTSGPVNGAESRNTTTAASNNADSAVIANSLG